jgi:Tfp pilus assembly protein FimT
MNRSHSSIIRREVAQRRRRGFTLTELLVLVVVMVTLASVAIPAMENGADFYLDLAQLQLQDACAQARSLAVSQRSPHGVVFDVSNERFAVVQEDGGEAVDPFTKKTYIVSFKGPNQARGIDLMAADFGTTGAVLVYKANGIPFQPGTLQLGCQGTVRVLTVVTGTLE